MKSPRFRFPSKTCAIFTALWLLAGALGIYFRLYPLRTYTSNDSFEKASLLVVDNIRRTVRERAGVKMPDLPETRREEWVRAQVNQILHADAVRVRQSIYRLARNLDRENPPRQTTPYLLASDSFYYYRLTEKILKEGAVSASIKGSKYFNEMMLAPEGHWEPVNLHPRMGFLVYKILSFFEPDIPLMRAVSFTPLVVMALSLVPFLVISFQLNCHWAVSLTGAAYFVLAPIFLKRSTFGWYDNDPYNTFFPLLILSVLFYGLRHDLDRRRTVTAGCLCFFSMVVYALFWHGWVFLSSVIFAAVLTILLVETFFFHRTTCKKNMIALFGILLAGILLGITLLFGIKEFFILFREGWTAANDFFKPQLSLWPNLYVGVGELHKPSPEDLMALTGGPGVMVVAVIGILAHIAGFLRNPKPSVRLYPFLTLMIFLVFSMLLALQAQRFALLYLVPLTLVFTLGLQSIQDLFVFAFDLFPAVRKQLRAARALPVIIILGLSVFPIITAGKKMPELLNKIYNDTWHAALMQIRQETPAGSIINTWWPPGHFISAMAKRRVTFDGATINKPQAYWMARVLMSPDEREAAGILRMLNNSANRPIEYLQESGLSLPAAVSVVNDVVTLPASRARQRLMAVLRPEQTDILMEYIFQKPPPSYLLIYNELVEKNIQLGFVANWDFEKIAEAENDPALRRGLLSGSQKYIQQVWAIEGRIPKYSGILHATAETGSTIIFDRDLSIDLAGMSCTVESTLYGYGTPFSLIFQRDGRIVEKQLPGANLPYSVILYKPGDRYACALMDTQLARSLLMRLYFFEGAGSRYFQPFIKETDLTQRTQISVFQVDWERFFVDIGELK